MFTKTTFLILAAVAAIAFMLFRAASTISGADAKKLVNAGAKLVDVRTPREFADGHIDGAVNIPIDDLAGRVDELGAKDGTFVLYCRSGARSARGVRVLQGQGFANVHNLGGMGRWD